MSVELRIPPLGESVSEGVIARWLRSDGDLVRADDPVLELETDKAALEIPAGAAGRLEIVEPAGTTVRVGALVARIAEAAGVPAPKPAATATSAATEERARARPAPEEPAASRTPATAEAARQAEPSSRALEKGEPRGPLSPAVRRLVEQRDLDPAAIAGTGKGGRLTKEDVLRFLDNEPPAAGTAPVPAAARVPAAAAPAAPPERAEPGPAPSLPAPAPPAIRPAAGPRHAAAEESTERVAMTLLRRRIAERLVEAQRTAAILTTFNEVDCTAVLDVRRRYRERFKTVHGVDLGLMSLFGRAVVLALGEIPVLNAQIDGTDIIYHRHVHLGIAVGTPRGLVVPVVRHAQAMTLAELEGAIGELARQARESRLVPDQLAGGTFSLTNGGVFGSLLSTPILNPPQSGILGMHKIEERPVAQNGQVVIHPMMYVALSYDHRLVDGEQAVTFLVRVKERLEDPVRMLLEV
jgi:2-oxoglutarate dehydrogenase E2 component (dihydrolipoamide succinyltransferase)